MEGACGDVAADIFHDWFAMQVDISPTAWIRKSIACDVKVQWPDQNRGEDAA